MLPNLAYLKGSDFEIGPRLSPAEARLSSRFVCRCAPQVLLRCMYPRPCFALMPANSFGGRAVWRAAIIFCFVIP